LWLYAKGHYLRRDIWKELQILVALRCLLEPEHVSKGAVLSVLGGLVLPILLKSKCALEEFIGRLSPEHCFYYTLRGWKPPLTRHPKEKVEEPFEDRVLAGYLSIMAMEKVNDDDTVLIPLDPVDPKLLPTVSVCLRGGRHEKGIDGMHQNVFCKKCFQSME